MPMEGETKTRLFVAGVRLFAEKGFKAVTVREICREAGAANINAINYHFGGKAELYREILDQMFSETNRRFDKEGIGALPDSSPEERFRDFIFKYCRMLFGGGEIPTAMGRIFINEMAHPSPFLEEALGKYAHKRNRLLLAIVRDMLGTETPENVVRDCTISVGGQILYYTFAWPVLRRVFPDHPGMAAYVDQLAEHVTRFSLGGIAAIKAELPGSPVKHSSTSPVVSED